MDIPKDGVKAIIMSPDKILLFHRDNIPTIPSPDCWHFVGGEIDKDETDLDAVLREVKEEVTFVPKNIKFWGKVLGTLGQNLLIYVCFVSKEEESLFKLGKGEGQEIGFFTIEEALRLKLSGQTREFLEKDEIVSMLKDRVIPTKVLYGKVI